MDKEAFNLATFSTGSVKEAWRIVQAKHCDMFVASVDKANKELAAKQAVIGNGVDYTALQNKDITVAQVATKLGEQLNTKR